MKRILGLDIGDKTIGVAVSDLLGITAQGITTIRRTSKEKDLSALKDIVSDYKAEKIVVGLPKNMDGSIGFQGEKVISFTEDIKDKLSIDIEYIDERLTTVSAERVLIEADLSRKNRKKVIDKVAATYILQFYLDSL